MGKNKCRSFIEIENLQAPNEFKLWNAGENLTDYGPKYWTENSAQLVMSEYEKRGNMLGMDIEHTGSEEFKESNPGVIMQTAGYCELELRDGEPWVTFHWSQPAIDQIESGQRRYLSPEFITQDGEITTLIRISLVHEPGTWNQPLLCSKQKQNIGINLTARNSTSMNESDLKLIGAALMCLKDSAEKISDESAKSLLAQALQALMDGMGDVAAQAMDSVSAPAPAPAADKAPEAPAAQTEMQAPAPAPQEEKKPEEMVRLAKLVSVLENENKNLNSKLDGIIAGFQAAKIGVSSEKIRTAMLETHGLTLEEVNRCKAKGIDLKGYAASKARVASLKK